MKVVSVVSGLVVIATMLCYFVAIPASTTIRVGDTGYRVNEIGRYGYVKSVFSLSPKYDAAGNRLEPSAFLIDFDGYHLLIWHNDRIDSMTHFRLEQPVTNTYGDWHDVKEMDAFTIHRPSPIPFFVGVLILFAAGFLLKRFRRTSIVLYLFLILLMIVMTIGFSVLAGTIAVLPILVAIGWLAAAVFGNSLAFKSDAPTKQTKILESAPAS